MVPSRGATDGMAIHAPSSPTIDSPVTRPAIATPERHHSREHRPERHEQDDERCDDADHLGRTVGPFLQHGRELPAELHLDIGPVGRAGGVEQQIERGPTELGGRRVELHRSERRRAVG